MTATATKPKLASEMAEDEARFRDSQVITVSCAECPGWRFTGPAGEARDRSAAHQREAHPGLARQRAGERKDAAKRVLAAAADRRAEQERGRKALKEMDAGERQRKPPAPPRRRPGPAPTWTRERATAAVRAFEEERGRLPTRRDLGPRNGLPSFPTAQKLFGTHAGMIEAAGYERPRRGRRTLPAAQAPEAAPLPAGEAGGAEAGAGGRRGTSAGDGREPGALEIAALEVAAAARAADAELAPAPANGKRDRAVEPLGAAIAELERAILHARRGA